MSAALIASTLAELGAKIGGGIISRNANRDYENTTNRLINNHELKVGNMFSDQLNRDFFDGAGKSALTEINKRFDSNTARAEGQAATMGATDEAKIAGQTAANEAYGSELNQLTGMGQTWRDKVQGDYMNHLASMVGMKTGVASEKNASRQATAANLMSSKVDTGNLASLFKSSESA